VTQKYDKLVHFSKAKSLLENDDLQSIRYACLELRYFIEAHARIQLRSATLVNIKQPMPFL